MKKLFPALLLMVFISPANLFADEGMWLTPLIKSNNEEAMKRLGLQIPIGELTGDHEGSLTRAVVSFAGGCTASFISPEGLLLTNYHCSYGAIQQHASIDRNIIDNGYWALSRGEELPVTGHTVVMNVNIVDITDEVEARLAGNGKNSSGLIKARDDVSARYSQPGLRNVVKSYKGGTIHILYQQQVFEDVRLVGIAPRSVAKFGGESDNWMWPRHSCDFAYFRVYVSPDGKPAKYSPVNVPYRPEEYLRVSTDGPKRGDFAMSLGYPGYTDRQATARRIREVKEVYNVPLIDVRGLRMDIFKERMDADPVIRLKYAEKYSTAANYLKNARGMNEWIERLDVIHAKKDLERDLVSWINADPERKARYPDVEAFLNPEDNSVDMYEQANAYLQEGFSENSEMIRFAGAFGGWMYSAIYNPSGGAGKITDFINTARSHYKDYDMATDAAVTSATVKLLRSKLPAGLLPSFYREIDEKYQGDTDAFVDMLYRTSLFADLGSIIEWAEKQPTDYDSDPVVRVLISIEERRKEINKLIQDNRKAVPPGGPAQYAAAMTEFRVGNYYPDADGTLRISYGTVQDLSTDGGNCNFSTYLGELIAKEDPAESDYYVHPELKKIFREKLYRGYETDNGEMPVCFITNGDVTGGNSGSPMLNSNGEVMGLVFDCNWESMTRDYNYDIDMNRVICLDVRYMLLVTGEFSGSRVLVNEIMGNR